jgi:UTP--glucose-1-phosphate uridylyltransferase
MNDPVKVTKAVVLAAGFGTRFLPASKAVAKVMFPVIDKPIIQYIVEELVKAKITDIHFILSPFTQDVKEHFTSFPALNELLEKSGKEDKLEEIKRIESLASFSFGLQQQGRHGTGKAILSAQKMVGDSPFVLLFADEFYLADPPWISQLVQAYQQLGGSILGCIRTKVPEHGNRFGFATGEEINNHTIQVKKIVEKPGVGKAPSDWATMSGMVFQPEFFDALEKMDSELPLETEMHWTHGLNEFLKSGASVYGIEYQNYRYFDTGDKLGYLKTMVELGIENPEFGDKFKDFLKSLSI